MKNESPPPALDLFGDDAPKTGKKTDRSGPKSSGRNRQPKRRAAKTTVRPGASRPNEGDSPPTAKTDEKIEIGFNACYNSTTQKYLIQKTDGTWMSQTIGQLKRRLKQAEIKSSEEQDAAILQIEDDENVQYAGPLCGKMAGFHEENGIRMLVTESPRLIEPLAGQWLVLKKVFEELLVDGESDVGSAQWHTFMGWLKFSVEALRAGHYQQAQILALAGKADCGKSFVQHLLTEMLGGRSANGFEYLSGGDRFNAELFESEHIVLEDENMGKKQSDRAKLTKALKRFSSSTWTQRCRAIRKNGINLRPFWRVTITLNDGPDDLLVLPPLDDSIEDKIILLRASKFAFPDPFETSEEKALFRQKLVNEIPAFLHWLLNDYEIPEDNRDQRFGVKAWHHPKLKAELDALSTESQMLMLIDEILWDSPKTKSWRGDAKTLRRTLLEDSRSKAIAAKLLSWTNATGTMLGKLAKKFPDRVENKRTEKKRSWVIHRPAT